MCLISIIRLQVPWISGSRGISQGACKLARTLDSKQAKRYVSPYFLYLIHSCPDSLVEAYDFGL